MLGATVNCLAVFIGGCIGLIFNKNISEKMGNSIMNGLALCVLFIGIDGALSGENILMLILSIAIGAILGEWMDLDDKINKLGEFLENRVQSNHSSSVSQGFVTASLLFCVGAMAIVGSLQSGLSADHETLFAKSLIDGICAAVLASGLGFGVLFSGILVFLYEGSITLFAQMIEPYLTTGVINEMICVGSILIIGLAFNMLKLTKLKIMNYLPAVFIPLIWSLLTAFYKTII